MKKIIAFIMSAVIMCCLLSGCQSVSGLGEDDVYFSSSSVISAYFEGLGVEWGTYDDVNKLSTGAWDRITQLASRLNPALVRCMFNYDWFVGDFDNKGNDDVTDDTWTYDFDNKYMENCCDILDYCQNNGIKVAVGAWNAVGDIGEDDVWGMIPNTTSDIRWAKMTADVMEYLVVTKGYSCIKWFVNSNEPNYLGTVDSSKNAYNTYAKWEQGVKNVRIALDAIGLAHIDIIGGDTTGFTGSAEYLPNIANNLSDIVNNYGIHMYISNYDIDNAVYYTNLKTLYEAVQDIDNKLGVTKPLIIWEAGLLDGKDNATDCNRYIANYSYGIRMADYTIQSILAGANGVVYWDLDDAMHFMYGENGATAKEWGMFSTLATATAFKQEIRPWYHSSVLLTNLLSEGNRIYQATTAGESNDFRALATVNKTGTSGGIVAVNRGLTSVTKNFCLGETVNSQSNKLYIYIFNELNLRLGEDGFVVPNYTIEGSINNITSVEIPANSMVIISTEIL